MRAVIESLSAPHAHEMPLGFQSGYRERDRAIELITGWQIIDLVVRIHAFHRCEDAVRRTEMAGQRDEFGKV